ncbi:MAG: FadR family transcriptional regulator [Oscillospiraceae bacterium]|nr:FadR family transcriptional regulator [Oscillospiraceae bacterium]
MTQKNNPQISISEQVLNELRNQIAAGLLKDGTQLPTEAELAKQFNVSRASVREAIKTLNYLGIVESCTSRGTRITSKSRLIEKVASWTAVLGCEDIRDAFVLGTALDTQVTIIVAERLNHDRGEYSDFCAEIVQILAKMAVSSIQKDLPEFRSGFSAFFRSLYDFSQNTIFISLNECIDSLIAERVCAAYYTTGTMLEAVQYYNSAWNAISSYNTSEGIAAFQNYGAFAYDIMARYEGLADKAGAGASDLHSEPSDSAET